MWSRREQHCESVQSLVIGLPSLDKECVDFFPMWNDKFGWISENRKEADVNCDERWRAGKVGELRDWRWVVRVTVERLYKIKRKDAREKGNGVGSDATFQFL